MPLADHGTTARAKGRPAAGIRGCSCRPCRSAENAYSKRRRFLNDTGRTLMVDATPVAEHLRALFAAGAGWIQLGATTGCSTSTIQNIITGQVTQCRRSTANKLLAATLADTIPPGRPVPALGSIRRVHALMALGHRCLDISRASDVEHSMISDLVNERVTAIKRHVAERIEIGFRKLAASKGTSVRSLNRATRNAWAPPGAWDDNIDDPTAVPDWTGYCGTDRGYWTHKRQNLPMCARCQTAHDDWLTQHADLPGQERARKLFAARAAASSHEADVAHDARELMRVSGLDSQQAAERLGVTRQHLQQALLRHPEQVAA